MFPVDEELYIQLEGLKDHQHHRNTKSLFQLLINRQKNQHQSVKQKLCKTKKRGKSKYWKQSQNKLYAHFLQENIEQFHMPLADKIKNRIHVQMSLYVRSKNPKQCRSHHQKMVEKYGNIENIISHFLQLSTSQFMRKETMFDQQLQSYLELFPIELDDYDDKQVSINSYV